MNKKKPNDTLWWVLGITGGLFTLGTAIIIHQQKIKAKAKKWLQPVTARISSPFGHRTHPVTGEQRLHNGIDLAVPVGTQVRCPMDGSVSNVFYSKEGGNQITIKHSNGFQTGYAHLSKVLVKKGEKVKRGSVIALSGNTGRSTGPHVHLTLRNSSGALIDPAKVIYSGVG
jgi:murein DD-endopeptidase MepM/ murein hydrolase activator NlpD